MRSGGWTRCAREVFTIATCALGCGGPVTPCTDLDFFAVYDGGAEVLRLDSPAFVRERPGGSDHGGFEFCGDVMVLRVIGRERGGVWEWSLPGGWLARWVAREAGDSLFLSDGSRWVAR